MVPENLFRGAVVFIAVATLLTIMNVAEQVFAPLTLAIVMGVVLAPLMKLGERISAPPVLNAALVLLFGVAFFGLIALLLSGPVAKIFERAPVIWFELRVAINDLQRMFGGLDALTEQMSGSAGGGDDDSGPATALPSVTDALMFAPNMLGQIMIFSGGLFFFLLSREQIYGRIAQFFPTLAKRRLVEIERTVSRYFITISIINACYGASLAVGLWWIGMPQPILWGVIAGAMNYILYLGPAAMAVGLAVAGAVVFNGVMSLVPPLMLIVLNLIEGQFVTPSLVGKHIQMNPLLIFVSLVFWLWLWGPLGGFVAIPLLIAVVAVLENISRGRAAEQERLRAVKAAGA